MVAANRLVRDLRLLFVGVVREGKYAGVDYRHSWCIVEWTGRIFNPATLLVAGRLLPSQPCGGARIAASALGSAG